MRGFNNPLVSKNVPIPEPPKPRKIKSKRINPPSPWIEFLESLEDGDSFLVFYTTAGTVKKYLKQLNISFEQRYIKRMGFRFWITKQTVNYIPTFIALDI